MKSQTSYGCLGVVAIFFLIYVALFGSGGDSTPTPTPSAIETVVPTPEPSETITPIPKKKRGEALRALAKLPIKGRAPQTGYSREMFSDDWDYYNGCDVRNRILARDLFQYNYRYDSYFII